MSLVAKQILASQERLRCMLFFTYLLNYNNTEEENFIRKNNRTQRERIQADTLEMPVTGR
jgi:hypothetical protein